MRLTPASTDKLVVRLADEGDGTGYLWVRGSAKDFAGTGEAWLDIAELQQFAQALTRYPLSENDPPTLSGGFLFSDRADPNQEHVFLQVYPADALGHLRVHVRLATDVWSPDRIRTQHRVQLEIRTGYQALLDFSRMLNAVIQGKADEAVLIGDM